MSLMAQWVPLFDNCLASTPPPHTFTYCTVSNEGMPRARTCVFRSWLFNDKSTGVLIFTTDRRSYKIEDLDRNDGKFEACFYFPNERCQFRLSGFSQLLTNTTYPTGFSQNIPPVRPLASPSSSPSSTNSSNSSYYPLFTPSYDSNKQYEEGEIPPPSKEEWVQEYERMWQNTPSHIKSSFRKPTPRTLLTEDARRQIDSINRGVDGSSDESGKDNFVIVCLFVNSVDYYLDEPTGHKRQIFTRTKNDDWIEQDVCP